MKRNQAFHEQLIPLLVEGVGAESYLEFGTYINETIKNVKCPKRYGVDTKVASNNANNIWFFEMTTKMFIERHAAEHAPFDFVFIDSDHSAEAVEDDFNGIWPHVSDEGLVLLHDTNPESEADTVPTLCGDAWKFAFQQSYRPNFEAVTLPYHPGLTIIRKRISWGPK